VQTSGEIGTLTPAALPRGDFVAAVIFPAPEKAAMQCSPSWCCNPAHGVQLRGQSVTGGKSSNEQIRHHARIHRNVAPRISPNILPRDAHHGDDAGRWPTVSAAQNNRRKQAKAYTS